MKVVVTGATGNIGTSVVRALVADPSVDEVVGIARRLPDWDLAGCRFVSADLRFDDLVDLCQGADAVVHLAWAFQPTHDPVATWEVNVCGSIRLFEAVAEAGVGALVYSSSVGAYSPGPGLDVDESWPTHSLPSAAYGREKSYLERYLDAFEQRHPVRTVRIRPAFVFKRTSGDEQRRIFVGPLLPRVLIRPNLVPVLPVPAGLRFQAVHADDLADAFCRATTSEASGAFNVAAEPILDAAALGAVMRARPVKIPAGPALAALSAGWRLHLVRAESGLLRLLLSLPTMHTMRARDVLGWQPKYTGKEALAEMLAGLAEGAGEPTAPMTSKHSGNHSTD